MFIDELVSKMRLKYSMRSKWWSRKFWIECLVKDKEIAMEVVKKYGMSLYYVSNALKNDKEVVMCAVMKDGLALEHASAELRNDEEVVMRAVLQKGIDLEFSAKHGLTGKKITMRARNELASKYTCGALRFANTRFHNNIDMVILALYTNPNSLSFSSYGLQTNPKMVLLSYCDSIIGDDIDICRDFTSFIVLNYYSINDNKVWMRLA